MNSVNKNPSSTQDTFLWKKENRLQAIELDYKTARTVFFDGPTNARTILHRG